MQVLLEAGAKQHSLIAAPALFCPSAISDLTELFISAERLELESCQTNKMCGGKMSFCRKTSAKNPLEFTLD